MITQSVKLVIQITGGNLQLTYANPHQLFMQIVLIAQPAGFAQIALLGYPKLMA